MIIFISSAIDRQVWIHDIRESAIALSQGSNLVPPSIESNDLLNKIDSSISDSWKCPLSGSSLEFDQLEKMPQSRTNTIVHVCWQRACSINYSDYQYALTVS